MSKIYSRKRFILKPRNNINLKVVKFKKKTMRIILILIVIILLLKMSFNRIEPVFKAMCEEKAKSIATIITNQQSSIIINNYKYEELYTIEKDSNGNIAVIKSNVAPINNMVSQLTEAIQNKFDSIEDIEISIPFGNLTGIYFLSGFGPDIPLKISMTGMVDTEIKSEFISQGINQTLHRVYVNFECNMSVVTSFKNYDKKIVNQVIIAEHVIVGNIPDSYYNLEGMSKEDTMNVIQ